ncbi:glutamine amidotransferase [Acaricomes phytoseiuli]|uniref:glutamine amidotransferase n=1 Tax=Acaricomes phytoseiuli TaxID=291968 RepID=UPI00036FFA61|nr:glutamine amidotransferase [Acaricomes phytoseiuli]MCW1250087.1 glutamine amidotransferase [Acaricomes phytoseiuli]
MTRDVIAIRHVLFEDLGLLEPLLESRGYRITYLNAGVDKISADTVRRADLLVVLGGPIGVYDIDRYPFLRVEKEAISARLTEGLPTLGICLGAQLLAAALSAPVNATGRKEIGYAPLSITGEGRKSVLAPLDGVPVLHWHGDQFQIPDGARRLAETSGFPNQAFDLGPNVLGLQFHLEADHRKLEQWLIGHAHELAAEDIDPRRIRDEAEAYGSVLAEAARGVLGDWLDHALAGW